MDHRDVEGRLVQIVEGTLEPSLAEALRLHVDGCDDCRGWLETCELLTAAVQGTAIGEHPDSSALALCAVRPEEQFEPGRADIRLHLETCTSCRDTVELLRHATEEARPQGTQTIRRWPAREAPWKRRFVLAASIAASVIGSFVAGGLWRAQVHGAHIAPASTTVTSSTVARAQAPVHAFSEPEVAGTRVIEADGGLMISRTRIMDGAQVTIRAGHSVAFGNGFQIGPRATVAVGGNQEPPPGKSSAPHHG